MIEIIGVLSVDPALAFINERSVTASKNYSHYHQVFILCLYTNSFKVQHVSSYKRMSCQFFVK